MRIDRNNFASKFGMEQSENVSIIFVTIRDRRRCRQFILEEFKTVRLPSGENFTEKSTISQRNAFHFSFLFFELWNFDSKS